MKTYNNYNHYFGNQTGPRGLLGAKKAPGPFCVKKRLAPFWAGVFLVAGLTMWASYAFAANIDSTNKYSYGENAGWQNWAPTHGGGVTVAAAGVIGYLWAENTGWIKMDYDGVAGATNTTSTDWGVTNDGNGNLAGYAWGENAGWINFNPANGGVSINGDGKLSGYAWAENTGWINFSGTAVDTTDYYVAASWIPSTTDFVCSIEQDATGDYTTLNSWQAGVQCDLTRAVTSEWDGQSGVDIADRTAVTWDSASSSGTLIHMTTVAKSGKAAFLLVPDSGDVLEDNDVVVSGANTFIVNGTPTHAVLMVEIDGAWTVADSSISIDGWTTSAANYIKIYTTAAARHSGKWSTGAYTVEATAAANDTYVIDIKENYIRIEGVQVHLTNSGEHTGCSAINIEGQVTASDIRLDSNILKGTISGTSSEAIGIYGNDAEITAKIYNNIIYNFINGGITNKAGIKTVAGGTYYLYNNTVYGNDEGINAAAGTVVARNNLCNGNTAGKDYLGTFDGTSANNISEDTTSPNAAYQSKAASFIDETGAPPDFHLSSSDTNAREAGTDLSSDPNLAFSDDIDGDTRPTAALWDIGADEADLTAPTVAAAGVSSTLGNGSYKAAQVVPVTVTFSEAVTVTGIPQITLSTGSPATTAVDYVSGSGSAVLTFDYTVAAGNTSADLDYEATTSLALNSGTIKDAAGNPADLTLAAPAAEGSLGYNKALVIDTTAPTADITYSITHAVKDSDTLTITAAFSEDMAESPVPRIGITYTGGIAELSATVMTRTDATHYTYDLDVPAGDGVGTIALSVGTDLVGNVVTAAPTTGATFTVDNIAPAAPTGATIVSGTGWNTGWIADANKTAVKVSGSKSADTVSIKIEIDDEDTFTDAKTTTLSGLGAETTYADTAGIDVTITTALTDGDIAVRITASDAAGNTSTQEVLVAVDTFNKDTTAPAGYTVAIVQDYINSANQAAASFTFAGAQVEAAYNYFVDDTDDGTQARMGNGTIATATDTISGINVSTLDDDTLTLTVYLTDPAGNQGADTTDTVDKDTVAPGGYTVSIVQPYINISNETAMSFTFAGAEAGAAYDYTVDDTNGTTTAIPGNGTIITPTDTISGINVSTLDDDTLTLKVYLTDTFGNQSSGVTLTIGGTAGAKVSAAPLVEDDNKTLVLDVTGDFSVGEYVTVSGAYLWNFSSGGLDNLELEVYNTGEIYSLDDKTIIILGLDSYVRGGPGDGWDYAESAEF